MTSFRDKDFFPGHSGLKDRGAGEGQRDRVQEPRPDGDPAGGRHEGCWPGLGTRPLKTQLCECVTSSV